LLANTPKQSRPVLPESNALYYFPEIPCGIKKDRTQPARGRFVGMQPDVAQEASDANGNAEDCPQVRELIEEAFCKGVEQGRAEVNAAHGDCIETAAAALGKALEETVRIRMQEYEHMETETVRLALAIAKKIIGHAAEHGQVVTTVVKAAMKKVADPRQLTLKLNPDDLDSVAAIRNELPAGDDSGMVIELEGDETIGKGGCIIEARLGDVNARIDEQIKIVEQMLTEQLPKPADAN